MTYPLDPPTQPSDDLAMPFAVRRHRPKGGVAKRSNVNPTALVFAIRSNAAQ